MRMGLEIDVERAAAGFAAGLLEGQDFCVFYAVVGVNALAYDIAARINDDGTDARIGRSKADALTREFECAMKMLFVGGSS